MADTTVYFATNREETGDPAVPFGPALNPKSPLYLRYGAADVTLPDKPGQDYSLAAVRVAPEQIPGVTAGPRAKTKFGSAAVYDGLSEQLMKNNADLVLLLHGYSSTFENALLRAAEVKTNWSTPERKLEVAVFCWPSDGITVPFISYASDRDDARSSAKAIARALLRLVDFFRDMEAERREIVKAGKKPPPICGARLHLVAHSMGNYALRNAFQALCIDLGGKIPRLFDTIFLMAADEDNDSFESDAKFMNLPDLARQVYVYFAGNDGALGISDVTKANPDRLGTTGPRTLTNLPQKVTLIDSSLVSFSKVVEVNHQYYRQRPEVVSDVQAVLSGAPPDAIANRSFIPDKRAYRIGAAP